MKVSSITNTVKTKIPVMKRIKNFFSNSKLKLRTLIADVYECHKTNYIIVDGKKVRERDIPNFIGRPSDVEGMTWGEIKFYPEDEAIMAKIKDIKKRMVYGNKLIDEGKFTKIYYENPSKK